MKKFVSFVILICLSTAHAYAQSTPAATPPPAGASTGNPARSPVHDAIKLPPEKAEPVRVPHFATRPVIDGRLDDEVWKQAVVLKDFYQTQPGDNIEPSRRTEVLIGYDARYLYFGFHAYDDPDKIRATITDRDNVLGEDNVRIFLDTFNDQRRAYLLAFNPLGIQADGILTEGQGTDFSVDVVMESKGAIIADGWGVEVAIPFKSLRYQAGKGKLWGFHVWRNIDRFNDEIDSWMPLSRDNSGFLNQAGHLTGLEDISTERTIELIPSLTLSETGQRMSTIAPSVLDSNPSLLDFGRFVNQPAAADPGLTAKFQITPNITFDAAINPDFAQIEADQTVVTANQRFPIFFEEKRPFFLEGIDIFQTSLQPVHTRTIIDPDYALKLTGKRGPNTFGILLASDNAPGDFTEDERNDPATFKRIERFIDKNAYIGVLRLKHDLGKESSIGFIGTTYNFIERHNHLGGFDGRFRLNPKTVFTFQMLGTTSRGFFFDPLRGKRIYRTGNAFGYFYNYSYSGRHFGYQINGQGRTRDYRADVGFTRRVNTNFKDLFLRYNSEPKPKATLISYRLFNSTRANFDWQGRAQLIEDETQVQLNFKRQISIGGGTVFGGEHLYEDEFGAKRTPTQAGAFFGLDSQRSTGQQTFYSFGNMSPTKKYSANYFVLHTNGSFDFDFGALPRYPRISPAALRDPDAPLDPGPGSEWVIDANFTYQPTDALNASITYNKDRLVRHDTRLVAFDANIFSLKSTYQFSRFTFLRARIDYDTLASNASGQFLFGWTPTPGTSFFAGYNDNLNYNGHNPFTGQFEPGIQRNRRTFFVKMSYLFRRSF